MKNAAERTTELRALFHTDPSPEVWEQVMLVFHDWDYKDGLQIGIDYASTHLETWPDELRTAPHTWQRVLTGEPKYLVKRAWERGNRSHPAMQLVRYLDLRPRRNTDGQKKFKIGVKEAKFLVQAKPLKNVTRLQLDNNRELGDDGVYELAEAKHLKSLRTLSLRSCAIGPQGIWDLIEGGGRVLSGLQALDVRDNNIGQEGARGLAQCAQLAKLRTLHVAGCRIDVKGHQLLAESKYLHGLTHLSIGGYYAFGVHDIETMLHGHFAQSLEVLELGNYNLHEQALKALLKCSLPALKRLKIGAATCTPAFADTLSDWIVRQGLTHIDADYAKPDVHDAIRRAMVANPDLTASLKVAS